MTTAIPVLLSIVLVVVPTSKFRVFTSATIATAGCSFAITWLPAWLLV